MNDPEFLDSELAARVATAFAAIDVPPAPPAREMIVRVEARLDPVPARGNDGRHGRAPFASIPRLVLGAAGVSALVAILMMLIFPSTQALSAMERMAQQLREVTSYRYHLSSTTRAVRRDKGATTWSEEGDVYWQAPTRSVSKTRS
jgi:hypothetical protein